MKDNLVNDCISRQAAIDAVRKAKDKSEAHRMLVQLPSAQPGWIPCSEEMPKKEGRYIVTVRNIFDNIEVRFRYWNEDCKLWSGDQMDDVLAWCEIPEPWEGAQDGV